MNKALNRRWFKVALKGRFNRPFFFTVIFNSVTRPGQAPKYIPGAINYKGYLATVIKKGIGKITHYQVWTNGIDDAGEDPVYERYEEVYRPFFNNDIVAANFTDCEAFKKKYAELDIRQIIGTEAEKTLIKWGVNEAGLQVEDAAEVRKQNAAEAEQKKLAAIKEESGFDFIHEKTIYYEDEDGKQPCYHYILKHVTGVEYRFSDRSVFDAGRCINPEYEIAPGWGQGGLLYKKHGKKYITEVDIDEVTYLTGNLPVKVYKHDNRYRVESDEAGYFVEMPGEEFWWHSCSKDDGKFIGWQPVRKVDELELIAYQLVQEHGNAERGIRM